MRELRNPDETPEHRLKRLRLRSWRRGIKEMDLILGAYADARLAELDAPTLDAYEALLDENDQDLYRWVSGAGRGPDEHAAMLADIAAFHGIES
ncbi:MAG: succinate dehydrogenase assembly factor 2 [Pseudomonadota bacterium]